MYSKLLPFEKLNNTRDLGGLKTADGKTVKSGLLFRSGHLQKASKEDVAVLASYGIGKIIDFRSFEETIEQPDPIIGQAKYLHLPAEDERLLGIERDKKSEKSFSDTLIDKVVEKPEFALEYMCGMYRRFISNDFTKGQYLKFIHLVDETKQPILWHCAAGKDRAGFAAIIVEEILGIPRDLIYEDYLKTNEYIEEEAKWLIEMFRGMHPGYFPKENIRLFFSADERFIEALYDEVDQNYASFEHFLREALGVDDEMKNRMKAKYLE